MNICKNLEDGNLTPSPFFFFVTTEHLSFFTVSSMPFLPLTLSLEGIVSMISNIFDFRLRKAIFCLCMNYDIPVRFAL